MSLPQAERDTALAGADGERAARFLRGAVRLGAATLGTLTETAVARWLKQTPNVARPSLFTDPEREQLAQALSATTATANLLGRARVRRLFQQAEQSDERQSRSLSRFSDGVQSGGARAVGGVADSGRDLGDVLRQRSLHDAIQEATDFASFGETSMQPLAPAHALEWFRRLIPGLAPNALSFQQHHDQQGFQLALTTEQTLLTRIHQLLERALETGQHIRQTPEWIDTLLDDAGVSPKNPRYAAMVFRTNLMEAYNRGSHEEMQAPDVREHFPVWRYVGIKDGRQGQDHERHFDRYYPNHVSFEEVRGPRAYNCRCTSIPIHKNEWQRLQEQGASVETFAEKFASGDCQWITIGGSKDKEGNRRGGSPVCIQGGKIVKDAPSLSGKRIGQLKGPAESQSRQKEAHAAHAYERSRWAKTARKEGIPAEHLHSLAAEIAAHDKEHVEQRKRLLKDTREDLTKFGYNAKALTTNLGKGYIEDNIPHMDLVARTMANRYPDQFIGIDEPGDQIQHLSDLLTEGNPKVLTQNEAYEQALEQLRSSGYYAPTTKRSKRRAEDEDVPFAEVFTESNSGQLLEVPDVPQTDSYSCGAAACMCVGGFFGVGPKSLAEWKELLGTDPEQGTPPEAIVRVLRELGLIVETRSGMSLQDLKSAWRRGAPVICPIQDYSPDAGPRDYDDGHYVTVLGADLGYVFVQDSMADVELQDSNTVAAPGRVMIREQRFLEVWHDQGSQGTRYERYGIVVAPPLSALVFDDADLYAALRRLSA